MGRLDNQVAVITGASRGLGRALAIGLAREGAKTVLIARDARWLEETARRVGSSGPDPLPIPGDIGNPADVHRIRETVLSAVTPTVVINNAGQFLQGPLKDLAPEAVASLFTAVVIGSALITQAFLPALEATGSGLVLNIGARVANPSAPLDALGTSLPYQTAKRHLTVFSAALRQEAPAVEVLTLYLPAIGSRGEIDDTPETVRGLYDGTPVVLLKDVVQVVADRLAGASPRWEEWVMAPA